jgi:PAS domain S-box-containing protein
MELPNILIVDDSQEMLAFMELVLKTAKAKIITANSGSKALSLIRNKELALAIVDVQMPDMNGYALALKINENRIGAIVPIIFLTAVYQDQAEIMKGYHSGAVDYIFKPVNKGILLSKINVFLELYNQRMKLPTNTGLLKKIGDSLSGSDAELADSRVKFKNFIEHAPDGVFIMDKRGGYLEMNEAACTITGYSREELLSKTLYELWGDTCKEKWESFLQKFLHTGTANAEMTFIHKNGRTRWWTLSVVKLVEDQYLCFCKDITHHKTAAAALKMSEEKYRTVINASPEGIIIVDMRGIITDVSEIGLEMYGASSQKELTGKHILRIMPPGLKDKFHEIYNKTLEEGLVQNIELKLQNKYYIPFISEISTTLIQGKGGESIAFMIVIQDITHRKKLERQMIHNDRMKTLGEMATGIAHEINQPLNTLSILFDNMLLAASKEDSLPKSYLDRKIGKIYDNIFRIKNIIEHVRVFSRSQEDAIFSSFDVRESIKNAVSMISEQFMHKLIELDLSLEENLPLVYGNIYQFEQVILNLLINSKDAIEEMESGSGKSYQKKIGIRAYLSFNQIILEISDNGIGIKPDELENIMLPFYTTKEAGEGTGLGLSITFGIIKEMKGEISFQSDPGLGTKVTILLPAIC